MIIDEKFLSGIGVMFSIIVFVNTRNSSDDDAAAWTMKYLIEDSVV
jgi:hypothetical protein